MANKDEFDLSYTTTDDDTPALFCDALESYLASSTEVMPKLETVLEKDPTMPMAIMFRGYLMKLAADPRFRAPINTCYEAVANREDLNEREQMHRHAFDYWQHDRLEDAVKLFDAICEAYPRDMLAARVSHYLHFYGSGGQQMVDSLQHIINHWQPGDRFYGFLKGMQSFAHEELGDYAAAEAAGREALDINPADIWATHAVTHVLQMQSRFEEGVPFIESFSNQWHGINNFANHMHWHKALQHIGLDQLDEALTIYDALLVDPLEDDFYLDVCNAASLLWRLEMLGKNVGHRWEPLLELSRNRIEDDELVFPTLHYLMAPAVLGDAEAVEKGLQHFQRWTNDDTTQGSVARQVGLPMAQAIQEIASGHGAEGSARMAAIQDHIYLIGGSHAQRDLFSQLISHYH
ncbi:MAG: tetratricopeptide repeat protein [Pseudomonadales bacterium]|nr:tetratricopeptide repeat protein [Pseudomonadales bacterium]MBO6595865.1 tetratricopeptide repeat protein [Pseudomonadales bacterium]MBO6822349.1 tetratricopeptide repeat protein [Pseudomonadales bacterium]